MPRTEEQEQADAALTVAIEAVARAYGMEKNTLIMDYVVVAETQSIEAEEVMYGYSSMFRAGQVSTTRAVGLLEVAAFDLKSGRDHE